MAFDVLNKFSPSVKKMYLTVFFFRSEQPMNVSK